MTPLAASSTLQISSHWRRELTLVALNPAGPGTLGDLTRMLGQATGAAGAVLWETCRRPDGTGTAAVVSRWLDDPHPPELRAVAPPDPGGTVRPDPVTELALRGRSPALPTDRPGNPPALFGLPVAAALPIDHPDEAPAMLGALTLLGADGLADDAFDLAAELVEILPELCNTLRERQTLALVQACHTILHDADVESPDQPLPTERLREHLDHVCRLVARTLPDTEVTISLQETTSADDRPLLRAGSGPAARHGANPRESAGPAGTAPPRAQADGPLMELPLRSGSHIWGTLRCIRLTSSPLHFTGADLSLLRPVATAVAQYWRSWLHRRTISAENDSWRQLATGLSGLNRLFAGELRGRPDFEPKREKRVCAAALRIVRDVVTESTRAVVSRAVPGGGLEPVCSVENGRLGDLRQESPAAPGPGLAERVLRTHRQSWTTDPDQLTREGAPPDTGWLLCTPVGVGDRVYGVLQITGPAGGLPANSAQVCEIVADQLGLYRHLQRAWQVQQASVRIQAETMEDLKHQLASPLRTATDRTDLVIRSGRFDTRAEAQLKAVRGLCRKANRVAMSAGVFAAISRNQQPVAKTELLGVDDLLRLLIAGADDAQVLGNPALGITFDVDRDSVRRLGRRLIDVDVSFLHQCLGNVLDNAAKYGYRNTSVRIGGAVTDSRLAIEVTSIGIPIDPADTAHCLQRNWRGKVARNTTGEGSGIGLWIVDNLMRAMRGKVRLHPDGDTTTVRMVLPLA